MLSLVYFGTIYPLFCSGRSGAISTKKIKNNMLAAVLVLTVVPSWVKVGRAAVEHACFLISQKLADVDEVRTLSPITNYLTLTLL